MTVPSEVAQGSAGLRTPDSQSEHLTGGGQVLRRVAIISYSFPPAGGATFIRMVKFARYLPDFGWHPTIITAGAGPVTKIDEHLLDQIPESVKIIRTRPVPQATKAGPPRRFLPLRLRGFLRRTLEQGEKIIPVDPAILWRRRAIQEFLKLHAQEPFDVVLTTSPPHSTHLVGLALRRRTGIPWVADFRDDWHGNPLFRRRFRPYRRLEGLLQERVVQSANMIVATTREILDSLQTAGVVVPNGYDPNDFEGVIAMPQRPTSIVHTGGLSIKRSPEPIFSALLQALHTEPNLGERLTIHFVGPMPSEFLAKATRAPLNQVLRVHDSVSHRASLSWQLGADILMLLQSVEIGGQTAIPGKLYEYLGAGKPVLAVAPPGPLSDFVRDHGLGTTVNPKDVDALRDLLLNPTRVKRSPEFTNAISGYERRNLTKALARVLDVVASRHLEAT